MLSPTAVLYIVSRELSITFGILIPHLQFVFFKCTTVIIILMRISL
jgi:hypothetical protein